MTAPAGERRVVLVTGGGGGIGAAIARELGRRGDHVVTVDPLVSVDGTEVLAAAEETTAGQIVAAGGSAQASNASVTDRDALVALVDEVVATHGRIDGAVNVAGITRPTGFGTGSDEDWAAVLAVHLDGWANVAEAVLPHLDAAGRGTLLGVTSGSGWRPADAGAYSAAKRAVASLTWQLGASAPAGVAVNAISPIAMTRMVTEAMARAKAAAAGGGRPSPRGDRPKQPSATGGLALGGMPAPEELAPLAAHLLSPATSRRGQILFAGGSEVATVEPPRLLEVVRTAEVGSIDAVLDGFAAALVAAEAAQATTGGANPRFGGLFTAAAADGATDPGTPLAVLVVTDRDALGAATAARLEAAGAATVVVPADAVAAGFEGARAALEQAAATLGGLDAVVVATTSPTATDDGWEQVVASHRGVAERLQRDAAWNRAAADRANEARPLRVVHLVDAASPGGRSRAQAAAQQARVSRASTRDRVAAFAVAVEDPTQVDVAAALAARLATSADPALSGAELAIGPGWLGLRSHPRPGTSLVFGGPDLPPWFDDVLGGLHP